MQLCSARGARAYPGATAARGASCYMIAGRAYQCPQRVDDARSSPAANCGAAARSPIRAERTDLYHLSTSDDPGELSTDSALYG
jgi:hypothetical protein